MKLKNILLIGIIVLCCGCKAEYKLDFTDEKITENLYITAPRNNMTDDEYYNNYSKSQTILGGDKFYNFEIEESNEDGLKLNFNYEFSTANFYKSYIATNCFSIFKFVEDDDKYYIFAQGDFKCLYYKYVKVDEVDVSITTNDKVIENNADKVNDNEYIWHIDLDNPNNMNIKLIADKKTETKKIKKDYKKTVKIIAIATGIGFGLMGLIVLLIAIKHKRVNRI